jgi:hypothetical protein
MFICGVCGKVYPDDCPTCPDRGAGRGVTVAEIKDALRKAPTMADVNDAAKHFGAQVAMLDRAGGDAKTMAIQIRNLARFRRWALNRNPL